jgi:alkylation response protein AidB-like acyl-CoA dehydrogenase
MAFRVPDHVAPVRKRVREFIETRVYPAEHELSYGGAAARPVLADLEKQAKEEGLYALGHPAHLGGGGMNTLDYAYVNEVIGLSVPAVQVFGTVSLQTVNMLDGVLSEEDKQRWLVPATMGDIRLAFALTEPGISSSDPTQIRTSAEKTSAGWVLNGRKWFISALDRAAATIVIARTEEAAPRHSAFSAFMVPAGTAGVVTGRDSKVMGLEDVLSGHFDLELTDVHLPDTALIGERGQGFALAQNRLGWGRIYHCMRWLGQAQRAFDFLCDRANSRSTFGSVFAEKQLVQESVFDSYAEIQGSRLMVLDAAEKIDHGNPALVELSALKVVVANMACRVIDRAVQIHGAEGLSDRLPLEHMLREARFGRVVDGPDAVHLQRSAKRILREYREGRGWDFAAR